uniref:HD domain-containing protein n=1 Tax=Thaumasiovibrio occultus TaxID=1891184 RepID=UPI000B35A522|nr:hypothetical protein [Thaumasiovibrio occultus]
MDKPRWIALMCRLGLDDNADTFDQLLTAYSDPERHYHNVRHIHAMLDWLDKRRDDAQQPDVIELAIWFHDAIYKPFSSTNEQDSADWAAQFLTSADPSEAGSAISEKVSALILATASHALSDDPDTQLLLDLDLAILGCNETAFAEFERGVRHEYRHVPQFLYRKKRAQVLNQFLAMPQIYQTAYFVEHFETQARENLRHAIAELS